MIYSYLSTIWQGVASETEGKQVILASLTVQGLGARKEIGEALYYGENTYSTQALGGGDRRSEGWGK